MRISILTIHPNLFQAFLSEGLIGQAISKGLLRAEVVNIRDYSDPPHFRVDDHPYGGGPGMILKPEPIVRALKKLKQVGERTRTVVLAAKGKKFSQSVAKRYSKLDHLILICGRYEGIDERIIEHYADEEVRIGDYVLMGGEVAAQVIFEATTRLMPGVLGNPESLACESFGAGAQKEYAQYTRPAVFEGHEVPKVLRGGNHKEIMKWRIPREISRSA